MWVKSGGAASASSQLSAGGVRGGEGEVGTHGHGHSYC